MQSETLIIVGEAASTYYRSPAKSKNKKSTLPFLETKPLSYQKSEVPTYVCLCDVMKFVSRFFPLGEGSLL